MSDKTERDDPESPEAPATAAAPPEPAAAVPEPSSKIENGDFARLLASSHEPARHGRGTLVKGTVVQIGDSDLLVDVGSKSEAVIARSELAGEDGALAVKVGDTIEATVVSADGQLRLSKRLVSTDTRKEDAREMLKEALASRMPVSGRVTASVKGGYEVKVGGVRGFCPFSQIDVRRQEDPTLYFNKSFDFIVKEYDPRKRNLILSRRALLETEAKKQEAEVRSRIEPGGVLTGTVVALQDFGAFVDLGGGVQGLLHVSEISHARVAHPKDLLTVGQSLPVHVLKVDKKRGKISLTRKPLEGDPWQGVSGRIRQGQVVAARVARVTEFGAFLELEPGVDGLLHVSELAGLRGGQANSGAKAAKAGDEVKVQVIKVEESRRRISLGLADEASAPGETVRVAPVRVGDVVTGKVERVEKFGVFLRLGPGRSGLVPNAELGTPRGTDHRRMFPAGTEMTAEVIEADAGGRKIRLSVTKAEGRAEREAVAKYNKDATRSGSGSLSILADAFNALKKPTPDEETPS